MAGVVPGSGVWVPEMNGGSTHTCSLQTLLTGAYSTTTSWTAPSAQDVPAQVTPRCGRVLLLFKPEFTRQLVTLLFLKIVNVPGTCTGPLVFVPQPCTAT